MEIPQLMGCFLSVIMEWAPKIGVRLPASWNRGVGTGVEDTGASRR
jgi:hypothetical protein